MIETAVVMLVVGVAMAVATPSFLSTMRSYRLNSGAQQVADALQAAKFNAVRTNGAQSVVVDTANNTLTVGTGPATPLPPGVQFTTISVTPPAIITAAVANAVVNGGTITNQEGNPNAAVAFRPVTGTSCPCQAPFNSRGLPNVAPGLVNWVYLTNTQNELMAVTITSAGSVQIWRRNAQTGQWS